MPLHPRLAVYSTHDTHETAKRLFLLPPPPPSYGKEMEWSVHNCDDDDDDGDRPTTDDCAKIPFPE